MEEKIRALFETYAGKPCRSISSLPLSGSARRYFRLCDQEKSYIGVYHTNLLENELFINFTRHFQTKSLHVPEIYCVSSDQTCYLQQDLGDQMLLRVVERERTRTTGQLSSHLMTLYKKALSELIRFQLIGGEGLDYARCLPRPTFDARCVLWDLNYFKYCFLKLCGVDVDEDALEADFTTLTEVICRESTAAFMFRDFQSRNIIVLDEEVYFIDYQGGRRGALPYDVASLLCDPIVAIPPAQQEELLDFYVQELRHYRELSPESFKQAYPHFALIRLLQALGAFGLRGLHERKQHFIDSILPGLQAINTLLTEQQAILHYPEIHRTIKNALNIFK